MSKLSAWLGAIGIAGLLAAAAPAQAGNVTIYDTLTGPQLASILKNKGYKADLSADSEGDPMLQSAANGSKYIVFFYNCDKKPVRACKEIQFVAIWTNSIGLKSDGANDFNENFRGAKMVVGKDGDIVLSLTTNVDGVTEPFIDHYIDRWEVVLAALDKFIGEKQK